MQHTRLPSRPSPGQRKLFELQKRQQQAAFAQQREEALERQEREKARLLDQETERELELAQRARVNLQDVLGPLDEAEDMELASVSFYMLSLCHACMQPGNACGCSITHRTASYAAPPPQKLSQLHTVGGVHRSARRAPFVHRSKILSMHIKLYDLEQVQLKEVGNSCPPCIAMQPLSVVS